jgi:hypothetical protein
VTTTRTCRATVFLLQVRRKIVHVFAIWIFIGKKGMKLYHTHCRNTACNSSPQVAAGAALNGSLSDVLV